MKLSEYDIREFIPEDLQHVAANMRQHDRDEVWALAHHTPEEALWRSVEVSRDTVFTGTADDVPVCIFGVKPPSLLGVAASPWMLGTDGVNFHSRAFLRYSRRFIKMLSEEFPVMENYVDARNTASIRWLQWTGFSVYYPEPFGRDKLPFHRFDMRARNV